MSESKSTATDLAMAVLLALPGVLFSIAALLIQTGTAHAAVAGQPLELNLTVGTDLGEGACATTTDIAVGYGDQVNYCYRVTNHGDTTLRYHTLHDDAVGRLLTLEPIDIAPGESYQYNRIAAVTETRSIAAGWLALAGEPDYVVDANDPAVLFADGFEGDDRVQFGFVDISTTGEELIIPSNMEWVPAQLPFEFDFYGIVSDQLRMVEFGAVGWDPVPGSDNTIRYNPQPILNSLGPGLFPYWTDMYGSDGRFFQQTFGVAPHRRTLLQWDRLHYNLGDFPESGTVTFQLAFEEGSGRVYFSYLDAAFGDPEYDYGRQATIGLGSGATFRLQYSRLEASLDDHFTLRFTPTPVERVMASAEVHVSAGAPIVDVQPALMTATLAAGATGSATLTIGNLGDRDLDWSLGEAPARLHFPATTRIDLSRADAALVGRSLPAIMAPTGAELPAFAWMDTTEESFVSLDAAAPNGSVTIIDDYVRRFLMGGDFIDGDFSAFYGLDWWSNQLVRMQTTYCGCVDQVVVIGPPGNPAGGPQPLEGEWVGMTWDASNDRLYAIAYDAGSRRSTLYEIDMTLISARALGRISDLPGNGFGHAMVQDIAVSPEGLMYGVDARGDNLVAIDKVSAEAAVIGALGIDLPNDYRPQISLDFDDASGALYLTANLGIHSVNTATGASSYIGSTGEFPLDSLAIATTSPCSRVEDIPWLSAPQTSGVQAPGVSAPVAVTFDADGLVAGNYNANLCVANNDPLHGRVIVHVSLTVE